jgi:hypothetical protein
VKQDEESVKNSLAYVHVEEIPLKEQVFQFVFSCGRRWNKVESKRFNYR